MSESIALQGKNQHLRILVVRPDRLGDVILSTPVCEVIKQFYSNAYLVCLVKENVAPLLKGLPSVDDCLVFDPEGLHSGVKGFFRLYSDIRAGQFRIALVLATHWKIAVALFFAGVRYRVGPLSKIHSFLFYNRGLRQRRSQVEMHETDYNLQLLRKIGIRIDSRNIPTRVFVSDQARTEAKLWLGHQGWDPKKKLVMVHPGMGGSALNWPESHYCELIRSLLQLGHQVLITGGVAEVVLLERILENLGSLKQRIFCFKNEKGQAIDFLAGLCEFSDVVVAPSTGPLHLAVALNRRVVSFYPPIRVQSAVRWGPYLADETRASVLVPENYCGQDFQCLGSLCNYFPCMKSLTVKQAIRSIEKQLSYITQGKGDTILWKS